MGSSVSPKDEIWFLHVCHHNSKAVYLPTEVEPAWLHIPTSSALCNLSLTLLEREEMLKTPNFEIFCNMQYEGTILFVLLLNTATGKVQFWCRMKGNSCPSLTYFSRCCALTVLLYHTLLSYLFKLLPTACCRVKT